MLTNVPTWTTDRVELLKSHFEAGLTCREIAASIGVSRNAVIGKLARLELTRGPARAKPRPDQGRPRALQEIHSQAAVSDPAGRLRKRAAAPGGADRKRTPLLAVRTQRQTVPLADQHARRRGFLLLRQHAGGRHALLLGPPPPRLSSGLAPARCEGIRQSVRVKKTRQHKEKPSVLISSEPTGPSRAASRPLP